MEDLQPPQNKYATLYMTIYGLLSWTGFTATALLSMADFFMKFTSFCFATAVSIYAIRYYRKSIKKLDK